MPIPTAAAAASAIEPIGESPRLYASNAEAAAYIEELLQELADMAQAAGHQGLSSAILAAALEAAHAAARSADKSA